MSSRMHKDDTTGMANGFTQGMNNLHQLYDPSHHPNHRQKFKVKVGTEVEIIFKAGAYACLYTKRKMEPVAVDLSDNKYFKVRESCFFARCLFHPSHNFP